MTKDELRHDPVLESLQKGLGYTRSHVRWIVLGSAAFIALVAVVVMFFQGRQSSHHRSALALAQAKNQMYSGQAPQARVTLEDLVARSGNSPAGVEASLLLGDISIDMGQADEAKANYEDALRRAKDPLLKAGALRGIAAAADDLGSKAEASTRYEEAAGDARTALALSDLLNAARTAREGGDAARARDLYARCLDLAQDVAKNRVNEIKSAMAELEASSGLAAAPSI